jgi:benzylsuccinate CoA-transferase BbsF subunit
VRSDAEWQALADVLKMSNADRARYDRAEARFADQDALDALVSGLTKPFDGYELMDALQKAKVASGVLQNSADVVERDPQLAHRDHFRRLTHPEMGETTYSGQPFKLASTDVGPHTPAPLLGQHNAEICAEHFGLSAEETKKLMEEGVLQ